MGACCASQPKGMHTTRITREKVIPDLLSEIMVPKKSQFRVSLNNVKCRHLKYKNCFVEFIFGKVDNIQRTRTTTQDETDPEFSIDLKFDMDLTANDLKKHHLIITLYQLQVKAGNKPLSRIEIDYYTLAFGPTHHTLKFQSGGGKKIYGQIQYNIEFRQLETVTMRMNKCHVDMDG